MKSIIRNRSRQSIIKKKKNDAKKIDALAEAQAKAEEAKAKALAAKEAAAKKQLQQRTRPVTQ